MSAADQDTAVSVRGEAQRTVAPDRASISYSVSADSDGKADAAAAVQVLLSEVAAELSAVGGVVLDSETVRAPLTWSIESIRTERVDEDPTGPARPVRRHRATAAAVATVRDFALLPQVEAVLTGVDAVDISWVEWSVDHDNAGWAVVRADAIDAALVRGRDYASALGGVLVSIDHVADAGLLSSEPFGRGGGRGAAGLLGRSIGLEEEAMIDPVPQMISAVVEVRLTARVAPLFTG